MGGHNHGNVRTRDEHSKEIILVPTPTIDKNDPLNMPNWQKHYVTGLCSLAILLCTAFTAGPSIALVDMVISFFGPPMGPDDHHFSHGITKTAYYFSVTALMMGVACLVWAPLAIKYGRRPVYIASFVMYTASTAWAAAAGNWGSMLAARIFMGCGAGAGEVLGPMIIADMYFAHERGGAMAAYTANLSAGVGIGGILSGVILLDHEWPIIYWVGTALIGFSTLLMFFTLPETMFNRENVTLHTGVRADSDSAKEDVKISEDAEKTASPSDTGSADAPTFLLASQRPPTHAQPMKSIMFTKIKASTNESLLKLMVRPITLFILPSVFWASAVLSVTIGLLVAMTTNLAVAMSATYGFSTTDTAWAYSSAVIFSFIGMPLGGWLGDKTVDFFSKRNGGIRDPEMRLPCIILSLIAGPLSLMLYGFGIEEKLHWIVPVIGLGLVNFSIVQGTNIAIVYMIDCYRPIAGESMVTLYGFKSLLGFLLSFYTNEWIAEEGHALAFGEMAIISAVVFLFGGVFYFWGKRIRRASWNWPIIRSTVHWSSDREVGE